MKNKIVLNLTLAQALAIRDLCHSSDQFNSQGLDDFSLVHERAVAKLEDAIEAVRGEFSFRMTKRKKNLTADT